MEWEIIGIEIVNYVSKKTNKQVIGKKFYAYSPIPSEKGEGYQVETFYCSERMSAYHLVSMSEYVRPVYSKYGILEDLVLVNK